MPEPALRGVRRGKAPRPTVQGPGRGHDRAAARHKRARLVLDALDMALWHRDHGGHPVSAGLIHHSDAGSQYTSIAFTAHLMAEGILASIGTVGDALDNALMESAIGLYKAELINRRGPWR